MEKKQQDLATLRHSAAHLLAHAVTELFPGTKLTIGPATEEGFFYDFLPIVSFKEEDLPIIEARMLDLAEKNFPLEHREISKDEARKLYKDNPFKLELIDQIPGNTVGLATQGDFYDLCRGGHVATTGMIKNVKLLGISGSYWRADRSKQPLQRISGTAFFTQEELAAYLQHQEELLKYDHRKIGKQLDLFSFNEEGVGFPFYHPKGKTIFTILQQYMRKLQGKHSYQEIATPMLLDEELWKQSGHYEFYKDNMYFCDIDERTYAVKPMNCPGSILVYKSRPRSYRELPLKLAEFGLVHRHELSGVLHGLLRVRAFTQDDAHIYCTPDQLQHEIGIILAMIQEVAHRFQFHNVRFAVSTQPAKSMGSNQLWLQATDALKKALEEKKIPYTVQAGEGAFYGPKIEVKIEDSMKRSWQCGTIQVDFVQAENFDLSYIASSGSKERPVIIHQAIFGSLERFIAIVLEHYKGNLPFWLSPIQARVLSITDEQQAYAQQIMDLLKKHDIRCELDTSSDPISGKIKRAQQERIPWMLVVGMKEVANNTVALRYLDGRQEFGITHEQLLEKAHNLNENPPA
jgi:threonyl-tRNA synthetase